MSTRVYARAAAAGFAIFAAGTTLGLSLRPMPLAPAQTTGPARASVRPLAPLGSSEPTEASFRNVDFHVADGVILRVRRLVGAMHGDGGIVSFDDPKSYVMDVKAAEVG